MADLDPAFLQLVLDVPERQREPDIQHHRQADDLRACFEVTEGAGYGHVARLVVALPGSRQSPLTVPTRIKRFPLLTELPRGATKHFIRCSKLSTLNELIGPVCHRD